MGLRKNNFEAVGKARPGSRFGQVTERSGASAGTPMAYFHCATGPLGSFLFTRGVGGARLDRRAKRRWRVFHFANIFLAAD